MKTDKLKWAILFFAIILQSKLVHAQNIAPQSINTAGAIVSQPSGSLSFVIGELVVLNFIGDDGSTIGSGFVNGAVNSTIVLSVAEPDKQVLDVTVYPNPTSELVNVQIDNVRLDWLYIQITDLQGKQLFNEKYSGVANKIGINVKHYPSGTYLLSMKGSDNHTLGTYKIIIQ